VGILDLARYYAYCDITLLFVGMSQHIEPAH